MNTWKKLLSMLLVLAMLLATPFTTGLSKAKAEEGNETEQPATEKGRVLETEDLDPADFQIHRESKGESELPAPEEPEEIDPEAIVSVMIYLDGKSTIEEGYETKGIAKNTRAVAYRRALQLQQKTTQTKIEGAIGHDLDVEWYLTLLVNAIAAEIPYKDIAAIEAIPGVKAVAIMPEMSIPDPEKTEDVRTAWTSEYMVGAKAAWAAGYNGLNSRIAILDSGIDPEHISFNEDAFLYAIEEDRADGKEIDLMGKLDDETLSQLNSKIMNPSLTADDLYVSAKIPYGYNYHKKNLQIDHYSNGNSWHGSHVAGIAAGNRYIKVGNEFKDAVETVQAVGMAPDAQLIVMNCGAGEGKVDSAAGIAALEDAIILGCDAANESFGGSVVRFSYGKEAIYGKSIEDILIDTDTLVSNSAGNEGAMPDFYSTELYIEDIKINTASMESTLVHRMSVASAENIEETDQWLTFGDRRIDFTEQAIYGNPPIADITGAHEFVYIDSLGTEEDYANVNAVVPLEGKIVIVNRGGISFFEKGNNAIPYHPKAVLVADREKGSLNMYMNLTGFEGDFPMVFFTKKDADAIKAASPATDDDSFVGPALNASGDIEGTRPYSVYIGSITVNAKGPSTDRSEAHMSDFSGWGVPDSLLMKPDITTPGGMINAPTGLGFEDNEVDGGFDQYAAASGTSMAAPHLAGLTGILAQRLRENPIENEALTSKYGTRAIMQSLLMSTATPMMDGENYISILQQGAGLADVSRAVGASSVIMMDDAYLTTATESAADGMVKVELGDDPEKTGEYTYKFTIYNIADIDLEYQFDTKMFTQGVVHKTAEDYDYVDEQTGEWLVDIDNDFMDRATVPVSATVDYDYEGKANGHDVNKDGVTDSADAQAILDYMTGVVDGEELDLAAGEMDGVEGLSSYDAELLLTEAAQGMVPAHGSKQITVTVKLNDTFEQYPNGAFVEGFTYVKCITSDEEGVSYEHEHTIPILGFYGDWTDPSMFDNTSLIEAVYGSSNKIPYSGYYSNVVSIDYEGEETFADNPYAWEDEYPVDRIAINSDTKIKTIYFNQIRDAGTLGYAISKVNAVGGEVTDVLDAGILENYAVGQSGGYSNGNRILNYNETQKLQINQTAASLGDLEEGDTFRIGVYALPEYTAMKLNDMTDGDAGAILDDDDFAALIASNTLGKGVFMGQDFTIDNTAPEIGEVTLNDETGELTVEVSDNVNIAYFAAMDVNGEILYYNAVPGKPQETLTFDMSDAIDEAFVYVALLAGDYAGNMTVKAAKVNDIDYIEKTVYVLTDEFKDKETYAILRSSEVGNTSCLYARTSTALTSSSATVNEGIEATGNQPYVYVESAYGWRNIDNKLIGPNNSYVRVNVSSTGTASLKLSTEDSNNVWTWDAEGHTLSTKVMVNDVEKTYYLFIAPSGATPKVTETVSNVYLFVKKTIRIPIDVNPSTVKGIKLKPEETVFLGQQKRMEATVLPITADQSVTWISSDPEIATVDENGIVKGIASGEATITATSVVNPEISANCRVTVADIQDEPFTLNAVLETSQGAFFSEFNTQTPEDWSNLNDEGMDWADFGEEMVKLNPVLTYPDSESETAGLYAFSVRYDEEDGWVSDLYTVDPSDHTVNIYKDDEGNDAAVNLGVLNVAPLSVLSNMAFISYYQYLVVGCVLPEETSGGDMVSMAIYDYVETGKGIVGVAAGDIITLTNSAYEQEFYYIDTIGDVYKITFGVDNSGYLAFLDSPTYIASTEIESDIWLYDSLYYNGEVLYWSHFNITEETETTFDGFSELIIVDPSSGAYLRDGRNFGEMAWPAYGLYVEGDTIPMYFVELSKFKQNTPLKDASELVVDEEVEAQLKEQYNRLAKKHISDTKTEAVEPEAPEANPVSAKTDNTPSAVKLSSVSRTNVGTALVGSEVRKVDGTSETAHLVTVTLTESEATTNGFFTVKYDPSTMTFVDADGITFNSYHDDETAGEVKVAYAAMKEIEAGKTIATLRFETTACNDNEVTITTTERGNNLTLNETATIVSSGHDWGKPTYTWSSDNKTCTAKVVCKRDASHVVTEKVNTTYKVTTAAAPGKEGVGTYTATFENPLFTTQTKNVKIPAIASKKATAEVNPNDVEFSGKTPYRVYNGKAQTPGVIVKDEKGKVIPASKYKVQYKENVKAGTAYIFVTFPNKEYTDCRTYFKIYLPATTWTKVENVENGIKISWTKVEGAAGYVVYRRAWNLKDAGWTTFERWNNTTATSWVDTKVYAGTRYQYGVKAYFARRTDPVSGAQIGGNVGDNYNLGLVGPLKTTVRITTRVLNSVTPASKQLTVKWTGSSLFTGYQVQVATDAKFTQNLQTVTIANAKTYEKAITGLKAGTTYYVRVRSYHVFDGTTYYGQWSNVMNAKTK